MNPRAGGGKLTLGDIYDLRAYERVRTEFRERVLELRRLRRVALGTIITVSFESSKTILYQIQEMARVEKLMTDSQVQAELDAYNPLVPSPGQLCATMFLELTSDQAVREWLPRLVGIERHVAFRLADGSEVRSTPEAGHASQLTRASVTSAVHYLQFSFLEHQIETLASGVARLIVDHPAYLETMDLGAETIRELLGDLRPHRAEVDPEFLDLPLALWGRSA